MRRLLVIATCALLALAPLPAAESQISNFKSEIPAAPAAELSTTDAIILGVIEGVTEFLPISSTGHLIIGNRLLHLDSNQPLSGPDGETLWYRRPSDKNPNGELLTLNLAAKTYSIVIQFGAIAAVAFLYWSRIVAMIRGLMGRDPAGRQLLVNLVVAFIPAAVIGLLLNNWIDAYLLDSVKAVIAAQVAGAFLMLYAESWRHRRLVAATMGTSPPLDRQVEKHAITEISRGTAATIGLWQCLAMWPGTSRSMTTIVGGYFAGLDPRRAAEFSFLLGLVTLTAAAGFKSLKSGAAMIQVFGWTPVLLGAVVAAVTATICVRFLVQWLTRHGLAIFAWYRLGVAAVLAGALYLDYL